MTEDVRVLARRSLKQLKCNIGAFAGSLIRMLAMAWAAIRCKPRDSGDAICCTTCIRILVTRSSSCDPVKARETHLWVAIAAFAVAYAVASWRNAASQLHLGCHSQ